MKNFRHFYATLILALFVCAGSAPLTARAEVLAGKVISATAPESYNVEGMDIGSFEQIVVVETDEKSYRFKNDFVVVNEGQNVYVRVNDDGEGGEFISLYDIDRSYVIYAILALFVMIVLILNFRKGLKSLASLALTIAVVFFVLIPALKNGYSPTVVGSVIAVTLLASVMLFTHGLNRKTYVAMVGTASAVLVTALLTMLTLNIGRFTGIGTDESFAIVVAGLDIDMAQLLYVGILIGMLGILDDVAITQASVVQQLRNAGVSGRKIFGQAMKIGQDHIGALVNTLVLAYTGAALPLLLLTSLKDEPLPALLSIEVVASEVARALLGSIGVILAVPITTFLAVLFLKKMKTDEAETHGHHH